MEESKKNVVEYVAVVNDKQIKIDNGRNDVYVWGTNEYGQLGLGHSNPQYSPVAVEALSETELSVKRVACGAQHLVLQTSDDEIFVCGKNDKGQLGLETTHDNNPESEVKNGGQSVPVLVEELSNKGTFDIACGYEHTVVLHGSEGKVSSFGSNAHGELGNGAIDDKTYPPTQIESLNGIKIVSVKSRGCHNLALSSDNKVYSWGKNDMGQLGLDHTTNQSVPTLIDSSMLRTRLVSFISCGAYHSIITTGDCSIFSFGDNRYGQLGLGRDIEFKATPTRLQNISEKSVDIVECGYNHTLFHMKENDEVYACGGNNYGQLGIGHTTDEFLPVKVQSLCGQGVFQIACGFNLTFFWLKDKGVFACGTNNMGQLGIGEVRCDNHSAAAAHSLPVPVLGIPKDMNGLISASTFSIVIPGTGTEPEALQYVDTSIYDDLLRLLNESIFCDVLLVSGGDGCTVPAHAAIIEARCPTLGQHIEKQIENAQIEHDHAKGSSWQIKDRAVTVTIQSISKRTLGNLLYFIYTDRLFEEQVGSAVDILMLAHVAQIYGVERLFSLCQSKIESLLHNDNCVTLLKTSADLNLMAVKRICLQYIYEHYEAAVAGRNRTVVEALGNTHQQLLAEIVALASDKLAGSNISKLPRITAVCAPNLVSNLGTMFSTSLSADVVIIPYAFEELDPSETNILDQLPTSSSVKQTWHVNCHRSLLVARSPVFARFFKEHYFPAPEQKHSDSNLNHKLVSTLGEMFVGTTADNKVIIREATEASPAAIRAFVQYLYTGLTDHVEFDESIDMLQMCYMYGLKESPLASCLIALIKANMRSIHPITTLCVAHQITCTDLEDFALQYVIDHFSLVVQDTNIIFDAISDFPKLGVRLLQAIGARMSNEGS